LTIRFIASIASIAPTVAVRAEHLIENCAALKSN
jgi:hypothetical protein